MNNKTRSRIGRNMAQRKALLKSLCWALIRHGHLQTTKTKAKQLQRFAEQLISIAKEDNLHSRRRIHSYLRDKRMVDKVFKKAKDFQSRKGGYTRIINIKIRQGDGAPIVLIKWVE